MYAYRRKTWVEKRNVSKSPEVKIVNTDFADIHKGEKMLIATPGIVDTYIRKIRPGHLKTLQQMRDDLARTYRADKTCPVTSGIFLRIVAEAAYEEYAAGKPLKNITPFWRIVTKDSNTAKKLSFGTSLLEAQQLKEGITHLTKKRTYAITG
jgi:hypothetical protein